MNLRVAEAGGRGSILKFLRAGLGVPADGRCVRLPGEGKLKEMARLVVHVELGGSLVTGRCGGVHGRWDRLQLQDHGAPRVGNRDSSTFWKFGGVYALTYVVGVALMKAGLILGCRSF